MCAQVAAPPAAIFHHGRLGLSFGNSRSAKRNSNPSPVTLRRILSDRVIVTRLTAFVADCRQYSD